jgi:hypothetical protein
MAWAALRGTLRIEDILQNFEFRVSNGMLYGPEHVILAVRDGVRQGKGNTEHKIRMVSIKLEQVLKLRRGKR